MQEPTEPRLTEQDVVVPVSLDSGAHRLDDRGFVGDGTEGVLGAGCLDRGRELRLVDADQVDPGSLGEEQPGGGQADSGSPPVISVASPPVTPVVVSLWRRDGVLSVPQAYGSRRSFPVVRRDCRSSWAVRASGSG